MKRLNSLLLLAVAFALIVAACGDDDAAESYPAGTNAPATTAAAATTMPRESDGAAPPSGESEAPADSDDAVGTNANATATGVNPADFGRMVIFTANLEVIVDDIVAAGTQAQAAVAGLGGFLFGQETTTGDNPRSVLTIKVLPENFSTALERLSGLGELRSQSIFADDVTERVVDLESQITTVSASVERLRGFLEDVTTLEDLASLESELVARETELELLRGRLRTLQDQVALATIVLVLTEPTPPVPEPAIEVIQTAYAGHDGGAGCPGSDRFTVDEGERMTVCYTITNIGDTLLADIEVREPSFDIEHKDLIVVTGDPATPLASGQRIIFAAEIESDYPMWPALDVTANVVDEQGNLLREPLALEIDELELEVIEDTSLPGFVDALQGAFEQLQRLWGLAVVAAGALVPFLWVPILLGLWVWYRRRRRTEVVITTEAPPPPAAEPEPVEDAEAGD